MPQNDFDNPNCKPNFYQLKSYFRLYFDARAKQQLLSKDEAPRWSTYGNTVSIWPAWDSNLRPPAPDTNALPIYQLASSVYFS